MPRDIPVGNGKLLVCFDGSYRIRDLYFPHVGQENHVGGNMCRFGVWANGRFAWVGEGWNIELFYDADTLVTSATLHHPGLRVFLHSRDVVDFHENVLVRKVTVDNLAPEARDIRLFFCSHLSIYGNSVGDTAAFDPKSGGIVHYKASRYFLVNGRAESSLGPDAYAVGQTGLGGKEGTYRDAEDGTLSGNPIAQGSVDSVLALHMHIEGSASGTAYVWMAAAESWDAVRAVNDVVKDKGPDEMISRTAAYWKLWANKETPGLDAFPPEAELLYRRSLLVLRTQIDWKGGILAANDTDIVQFNRDTYSYVWPRDGALVANALDRAGYPEPAKRFYTFAADVIEEDGYLLHKYNPDGTLASSWHPWLEDDKESLPIQEDETALVVWALWEHFVMYRDIEFIKPLYKKLVKNAGDFMCAYRDTETGLPAPSYDLWEERRGILSFTVGAVFGGLTAASLFCSVFGESDRAKKYQAAAAEIRDAASEHLWREDLNRFCRMVSRNGSGDIEVDPVRDASVWGLFAFGMYSADDPRIESTMNDLQEALWVKTDVGGMARYENDYYHRISSSVPGNPWFICTLWLADYLTDRAETREDLEPALEILTWVTKHALPSGVLAEQVNPLTGAPLSVSPLTWSHATFVASARRILHKIEALDVCPTCGQPIKRELPGDDWIDHLYEEACNEIYGICRVGIG